MFSDSEQEIRAVLDDLEAEISVDAFTAYLVEGIKNRELLKFEFSRNLSYALDLIVQIGREMKLSRDQVAFLTVEDVKHLRSSGTTRIWSRNCA